MGQITLRGIDPQLEQEIRRLSRKSGKSLNRVILEILYQTKGMGKKKPGTPAESLRELAGGWTREEAGDFLESIKSCEQIDKEAWA